MAFNLPQYDTREFSFGPCVIKLGLAGATPTVDVGAVRSGANFSVARTIVDINQGNPATLVKSYVTAEEGTLTLSSLQWNFSNFALALGVVEGSSTVFEFGGAIDVREVALRLSHETPEGHTFVLDLWKARGGESIAFNFNDDPHEFEYTFKSIVATTDWSGAALGEGAQLFKLTKVV